MISDRLVNVSERWFRLLQRLYPPDFRDDMGDAVVETYRDRARDALRRGGDPPACARLDARARRLAAQRRRRTRAARGVVAAQRQLGPRRGDGDCVDCCAPARSPRSRSAR